MKSDAQILDPAVAVLPRGWVIFGLAALAWVPVFAAWSAFSAIAAILL